MQVPCTKSKTKSLRGQRATESPGCCYALRNLQGVAVDKRADGANTENVGVREAIESALGGRTSAWLAAQVHVHESTVSRWLSTGNLSLESMQAVEKALGMKRGALLLAGGYVEEAPSVEDAVMADQQLTGEMKRHVIQAYQGALAMSRPPRRSGSRQPR